LQGEIAAPVQGTIFGNIMYELYEQDIKITELSSELSDEDFLIKDILILPTDTTTISYRIISLISGVNPDNDPTDPDDDYYTLNQMPQAIDNAINDLTIGDLFSEGEQTGLVSLFGAETKIVDFNSAGVASSLGDKTLAQLQTAGLISGVTSSELLSKTLNQVIAELNTLHP